MSDPWLLIGGIVAVFVALWLIVLLATACVVSAGLPFTYAATQGFVGIAAYILLWVLAAPFMAVASVVVGFVASVLLWLSERNGSAVPTQPSPAERESDGEIIDVDDVDDMDETPQKPQRRPDEMLAIDTGALEGL